MMRWLVVVVAAAGCSHRDPLVHPQESDLVLVENVPGLDQRLAQGMAEDCRMSTVIRTRFRGQRVIACGKVRQGDGVAAYEREGRCIDMATRAGLPYLAEEADESGDSDLANATISVRDGGKLRVFRFGYDSDPCGGGCPQRGGTRAQECAKILTAKGGCNGADCAGCARWVRAPACVFGGTPPDEPFEHVPVPEEALDPSVDLPVED